MQFSCWKCDKRLEVPPAGRVARREVCPKCDADLHCCRNCRFYDPSKHNQCAETQAEWVRDKEASNYCDYFTPNPVLMASNDRSASEADDAKKRFNSLFKS